MQFCGREYTREELMRRVGDIGQLAGATLYTMEDGKGRGMRAVEVKNGAGLTFTVLPDRGLDIGACQLAGLPIAFLSKTGYVSPAYYEPEGAGFLRSFSAGLVTTCGYTNTGGACEDGGKQLGVHGRATMHPSANTAVRGEWIGDEYVMTVSGELTESAAFAENIKLEREIECTAGKNEIRIRDRYRNCGYDEAPFMLLYHCNFGFPLVAEGAKVLAEGAVEPRDETAAAGLARCGVLDGPTHGYAEQVFIRRPPVREGRAEVGIVNEALGLSARLEYSADALPCLLEWKQMGEGDYVCGLEPATNAAGSRAEARGRGELRMLQPQETVEIELRFSFAHK